VTASVRSFHAGLANPAKGCSQIEQLRYDRAPQDRDPPPITMKTTLIAAAEVDRLETWQRYASHMCGG
jgi:hypothetical protein